MATKITTPELFNLSSNNTAATQLPVFTTSTRPTPTTSTIQVEYLVIGGGGAGGGWGGGGGAGGYLTNYGGSKTPLTSSVNYAIVVGEGGVKQTVAATAANSGEDSSIIGTGISITATGGGAGGTKNGNTTEFTAQNGGSGGGASAMRNASVGGSGNTPFTTPSQGNNGGNSPAQDPNFPGGGGGGGANANGGDGQSASGSPAYAGGDGGNGLASLITGTSVTRAGGGGGFTYGVSVTNVSSGGTGGGGAGGRYVSSGNSYNPSPSNAVDGQVNTGSGGGSGSVQPSGSGSSWYGGDTASGGSGIVILRYPTSSSQVIKTTGSLVYTESTDGSDTIIQFTEGSGNVSFASAGIAVGEMIFNSTTGKVEYWDGFQWNIIKDEAIIYPLSTTDPFGDGSQTALYKFAGNGNNENGTYAANVTASYVTGILGGGVNFSGSSSSLVTSLQPLSLGQSKTFWVNFDSINFNADKAFYLSGGNTSTFNFWSIGLYYQHSSGLWYIGQQVRNTTGAYWYTGTGYTLSNVSKTDWNLIYVSYNVGNYTYSINNSTIATNPKTISLGTVSSMSTNHDLGRIYSNGPAYYLLSGTKISSMRQFNRALSGSEIQQIYGQVY